MIRVVGSSLLAAGAALLGVCAVWHMNKRVCDLYQLILGLESMARELDYRLAPLPELLKLAEAATQTRVSMFFGLCAKGAEHLNGRTFQSVWQQAIEAGQLRLEPSDIAVLEQLGGVLGRYDAENQLQSLRETVAQIKAQYGEAGEERRRLGRVYSVLGITAGAFVMILLV